MYECAYFDIKELVSKKVFVDRGQRAWGLLDERALITLDALRKRFGPITVNDWAWGGVNQYRGLREPGCQIGATYSQHRFGRAFDCIFKNTSAQAVREYIMADPDEFPYISALELNTSWLHFDVRNTGPALLTFNP
ncbi:MAG: D-Ala-D-Ala carboxypeptidase family metallohydrolase [Bermanella sp.]|jgi:Peptidase M15.